MAGTKVATGVGRSPKSKAGETRAKKRSPVQTSSAAGAAAVNKAHSDLFSANAAARNMSKREWQQHLDGLSAKMFAIDPKNGQPAMSNDDFNREIGNVVISNLEAQQKSGVIQGSLMTLPKKGKAFVIGDVHSNAQNVLAIFDQIQSDSATNLDKNPNNKIVLLGDIRMSNRAMAGNALKQGDGINRGGGLHGEVMQRMIIWLQARYPDQVHLINGNHDMWVHAYMDQSKNPWRHVDEDQQTNIASLGKPGATIMGVPAASPTDRAVDGKVGNAISNEALAYRHVAASPMMVKIGDRAKGETVRIFQHSAGQASQPTPDDVAKMTDPVARHNEAMALYAGHGALDEAGLTALNARLGSDKIYFGHASPVGIHRSVLGGSIQKMDGHTTNPVGEFRGGGVYVDSQTDNLSGFVEIDLDNDKAPERVHKMGDVLSKYKPSKLEDDLQKMALAPLISTKDSVP